MHCTLFFVVLHTLYLYCIFCISLTYFVSLLHILYLSYILCISITYFVSLLHTLYLSYRRMNYTEAIQYLKDNNITKDDDGTFYEFGEVSYDS